jgi:phosphoglycolate phosphatase
MRAEAAAPGEAVDLVVFDLDGTLVDSREDISRAVNVGMVAVGGGRRPTSEITPHIGRPLTRIFHDLLPPELRDRSERASEVYREYFFEHCVEQSHLFPGVNDCLECLEGVSRAVATTKMTYMAERVVHKLGISRHFDLVQGSDGIPHKPDPTVLVRVLDQLGKRADRAWVVGDTVHDIRAGKAVGMRICAVAYGFGDIRELEREAPDLLLDNLADLPARIGVRQSSGE